jgi:hypothetical protein
MFVVDAAAHIADRESLTGDDRAVLIFAALSHDFAKATTTMLREREGKMRWTSWGHEADGGPMARTFLERIGIKSAIVDRVYRFEGQSDPGDEAIVFGLRCGNCGARGSLASGYGPSADPEVLDRLSYLAERAEHD